MAGACIFLGRTGAAMSAVGIRDAALWDATARAAGMPLWRLLGGARERVAAYGSGGSLALKTSELVAEMEGFAQLGYKAVKLKLEARLKAGTLPAWPRCDALLVVASGSPATAISNGRSRKR